MDPAELLAVLIATAGNPSKEKLDEMHKKLDQAHNNISDEQLKHLFEQPHEELWNLDKQASALAKFVRAENEINASIATFWAVLRGLWRRNQELEQRIDVIESRYVKQ